MSEPASLFQLINDKVRAEEFKVYDSEQLEKDVPLLQKR